MINAFVEVMVGSFKNIDKKQLDDFIQALIRYSDIIWIAKVNKALAFYPSIPGIPDPRVTKMIKTIDSRIDESAKNISFQEQTKAKESKKINISDEHSKLAENLVLDALNFNLSAELYEILQKLDQKELDQIMDYLLLEFINEFADRLFEKNEDGEEEESLEGWNMLIGLLKFVYPNDIERLERISQMVEELMHDYPQTLALLQLKPNIPGNAKIIDYLRDEVYQHKQDQILNLVGASEEVAIDEIICEIHKNYKRFGVSFTFDLFKYFDYLKRYRKCNEKEVAILKEIADKFLSSLSEIWFY